MTSKKYVELGRQFAHEQIKTVTGQAAVYLFAAWLDERAQSETPAPPCRRPISNGYPCRDYPNCECARERAAQKTSALPVVVPESILVQAENPAGCGQ